MYETDFRLGPVRNIFSSLFANHNMKLITISLQVRRKASEVKIKICFNFLLSFMFNIRNPNCEMFYTKKGNWNQFNFILLRFFVSLYFSEFIAKVHIFRDLSPYRPFQELQFNTTHPFSGLSLGKNVSDDVGKTKMKIKTSFRWYWKKTQNNTHPLLKTDGFRLMDKRKLSFIYE